MGSRGRIIIGREPRGISWKSLKFGGVKNDDVSMQKETGEGLESEGRRIAG